MSVMQNGDGAKKPITVKSGAVSAKIYHTPTRGNDLYTLAWHEAGKRKRKTFADLAEARREANLIVAKLARGQHIVLELSAADRESYALAVDALRPLGIPLHVAVAEFIEARKVLPDGCTLTAAVESFAQRHRGSAGKRSVAEVVTEFLASRESEVGDRQKNDLRVHLAPLPLEPRARASKKKKRMQPFADRFRGSIGAITAADIDKWLSDVGGGGKRQQNVRSSVVSLFRYAQRKGYLPRDMKTEAEMTERKKFKKGAIEILSPEEVAMLTSVEDEEALIYFLLGMFAGLRSAEALRMRWELIHLETGFIVVDAVVGEKTGERSIPIQPNLAQWLTPYAGRKGPIFTREKAENVALKLARKLLDAWPANGLRHSYASYRVAATGDLARVALEMGNSPAVIKKNYQSVRTPDGRVVTPEMAKAYFAIAPKIPLNVLKMNRSVAS